MCRTYVLAGLIALATAGSALADAGVPIPGVKRVTASHQVFAREAFPDHLFILCRGGWGASDGAEFVTIEPGRPLLIEFRDFNDRQVALVVVPRADAPPGSAADVAAAVFDRRISTATTHHFFGRAQAFAWSADRVTIDHRLRRSGDRVEVVRTSLDETYVGCCVAPVFLTLAAVAGGLYSARRWLLPARKSKPPERPME